MREIIPTEFSSTLIPLVPDAVRVDEVGCISLGGCMHDLDRCRDDARLLRDCEQPPIAHLIAIRDIYAAADALDVFLRTETASPATDARRQEIDASVRDAHAALVDLFGSLGRTFGAAFAAQVRAHQDSDDAAGPMDVDDEAIAIAALREIAAPPILLASMSGNARHAAPKENCDDAVY